MHERTDMRGQLPTPVRCREYTFAGNATLTLLSRKTGRHFTFKVTESKPDASNRTVFFVKLLYGSDNTSDYKYIGAVFDKMLFRPSARRHTTPDNADNPTLSDSVRAFQFYLKAIYETRLPHGLAVFHEGKCGRCGRKLTVPLSVARGIGPECAQFVDLSKQETLV